LSLNKDLARKSNMIRLRPLEFFLTVQRVTTAHKRFCSLLAAAALFFLPLAGLAEQPSELASQSPIDEKTAAASVTEEADQPSVASDSGPPPEPSAATRSGGFFKRINLGFSQHKPNYLLPLTWGNTAEAARDAEVKFQFSFKQQIYHELYFGYAQKSFWRVFDKEESRPFRETNYNPELFYRLQRPAPSWGTWAVWGGDLGIEHESNGARVLTSRSWNRIYLAPFIEYGRLRAELKLWHRLAEDAKESADDTGGDDNPDILDYYGHGELHLAYVNRREHRSKLMTRWNFATQKGAVQFDYSLPTGTKNLFVHAQLWSGYGETLIDYNRAITRYGIGFMFRQ
jgi:phospholipase A1/A2